MPYSISKLKNGKYQVKNKDNGKIHAKGTTKIKAEKQVRFLEMMDNIKTKVKI